MEMNEILIQITQYGVLPILLIIIYYLFKKVEKLEKELKNCGGEVRDVEKENLALTYKILAVLKKLGIKNENEDS